MKSKPSSTQEHVCPVIQGLAMQDNTVPESLAVLLLPTVVFQKAVNKLGAVKLRFSKYTMLLGLVWYDKTLSFPLLYT